MNHLEIKNQTTFFMNHLEIKNQTTFFNESFRNKKSNNVL